MSIGWDFPPNHGGTSQGFNHGGIDTFAGTRLSSIVREVIQNSLDARAATDCPVIVEFSLQKWPKAELDNLNELAGHLKECEKRSVFNGSKVAQDFFQNALRLIQRGDEVPCLVISDSNTTGLQGGIDEEKGSWFALTKGSGITQKAGGSLGSFGHGSMAPFAMSHLRTVFYITKIEGQDHKLESRFQGKSILQTHEHPTRGDSTQGIGFFGHKKELRPLVSKDIPQWARSIREAHSSGPGTTIIIPFPYFSAEKFGLVKVAVLANFFYSIYSNKLEVLVDGELLTQENIEQKFVKSKDTLEFERADVDFQHIDSCFHSFESVLKSDHRGCEDIPEFGKVDWYLRVNEEIRHRAVGISRESGMLITRKAKNLEKFRHTKNFDLFVFVHAGEGSNMMRRLENPAHDKFELDRIKGASNEKRLTSLYNLFTKRIREIIEQYASIDSEDGVGIPELANILSELDISQNPSANTERGHTMLISATVPKKTKTSNSGSLSPSGLEASQGIREGQQVGAQSRVSNEVGNKGSVGDLPITVLGGTDNISDRTATVNVENIRVTRIKNRENSAKIYFTTMLTGCFVFQLARSTDVRPDQKSQIVHLEKDGKPVSGYQIMIHSPGRNVITVDLADKNDLEFALEGWLDAT